MSEPTHSVRSFTRKTMRNEIIHLYFEQTESNYSKDYLWE